MSERMLAGFTVFFGVWIGINALVFWFVICRTLYRAGARFPTGLLPWRYLQEMAKFKELRRSRGDSLSNYYIISLAVWFNLLLGVVLAVMWMYRFQNPLP